MAQFRLCDLCGKRLDENLMDYATISAKMGSKVESRDICLECMAGALRITLPNGLTVTGLGAMTGDYSPAGEPNPPEYQESPATKDKPKEQHDGQGTGG